MDIQEQLTEIWKKCKTKQLAKIFETYMQNLEINKRDFKNKSNNKNTYVIDGKSTR